MNNVVMMMVCAAVQLGMFAVQLHVNICTIIKSRVPTNKMYK